jgi:ribonuclease E
MAEETAEAELAAAEEHAPPMREGAPVGGYEGEREAGGRRRRRRRRGGRGRGGEPREYREGQQFTHETMPEHAIAHEDHDAGTPEEFGVEGGEPMERPPMHGAPGEGGEQREGRHRRRRGRRGGRRNRRSGNGGEAPYAGERGAPPHEMHVGADFPPVSDEDASAVSPPFEQRPAEIAAAPQPPPTAEAEFPPPEALAEEAPRRRSTVREAAFGAEGAPTPPPTPVISSTGEEGGAPKRGWWAKRFGSDKT